MNLDDMYETAELYSATDFQIYLKHGWILLDIKKGDDACPVIFLVGKLKKEEKP